ncbi:hypothetical protein FDP41_001657 [Naegleria fowleri]|uniref:YDG domain-containing protein n=1 Tax=Naegleria fowleri TaxID=5763 RepID=A0A6A5BYB4_NAEFO|nr:uncharacterized protein FDP41_001657 [Naegleria fowleri]KAF0979314.1 hypothetical protein FDP41_001657 [Naegleria fowleri]
MTPSQDNNTPNNTTSSSKINSNSGYIDYDDMFFDAGRAANYSEQYTASSHQRLKTGVSSDSSGDVSKKLLDNNSNISLNTPLPPLNSSSTFNKAAQSVLSSPQSLAKTPSDTLKSSNFNISFIDQDHSKQQQESTKQQPLGGNSLTPISSSSQIKETSSHGSSHHSSATISSSSSNNPALLPTLQSIINSSPPTPSQKSLPTLTSPGVTGVHYKDRKRTISLQYLAEISNFSRKDVQDAMICKIDNETGEIYGNIPDIVVGMKFESRMDLLDCKLHTDLQSAVCTNVNYSKPAPSLIIYDSQEEHEDRGTVVLYSINFQPNDLQSSSPPSVRGTAAEALAQNSTYKIPVRVIRGRYESSIDREAPPKNLHCPLHGYRYDGLYFVGEYFFEPSISSYIFKLIRIYGQPELPHTSVTAESPSSSLSFLPPQFTSISTPQQFNIPSTNNALRPLSNSSSSSTEKSVFGIPPLVTQKMLSSSSSQQQQTYSKQSSQNYHDLPYIPNLPSNIPSPNSQNTTYNQHVLPSIPSIPSIVSRPQFNYNNEPSVPTPTNSNTSTFNSINAITRSSSQNQFYNISNRVENIGTERMNLTHNTIRQMISNLRTQNSKFNERIQQYSSNITDLNTKVEDVQRCLPTGGTSSRQLTSRNKTFTWKVGVDRSKYYVYDDDEDEGEDEQGEEEPTKTEQQEHKRKKRKKQQSVSASSSSTSVDQNNK